MRYYKCGSCGWEAEVEDHKRRCLPCSARRVKDWRQRNPEKLRAQRQRHDRKARIERREEYNAKRRRKRTRNAATNANAWRCRVLWLLAGDVTREELITIYEAASGQCHYCNKPVRARFSPYDPRGFDHVKPRAKDGKHTASNIVVCCRPCNELKGDK